jgi:hypothetical protein
MNIKILPPTKALPLEIIIKSVRHLPSTLARVTDQDVTIAPSLADSYLRVIKTDFSKEYWDLENARDAEDVINWCALGGSFLADFSMDAAKPRIFAWGLSPIKDAAHYALDELKGRDPDRIPTAACVPPENIIDFIDTTRLKIDNHQIMDYMRLGPVGIRVFANENVPSHFVYQSKVQFIVPGVDSPYGNLVKGFLQKTGYRLMGITSANFSCKGKYRDRCGDTHKNLDEIQRNMGFLGIPILAGPIKLNHASQDNLSPIDRYKQLHDSYLLLDEQAREDFTGMLPISVTIVEPTTQGDVWRVVRHGSIHYSIIGDCLSRHNIRIELTTSKRLSIGKY